MRAPLQSRNDADAVQTEAAGTETHERMSVDNRPAAVAQRKLTDMTNNSPRMLQQRALGDAIHNSPQLVAQRHKINTLFGGIVQRHEDGTIPAQLSPVQRDENPNNTGLPNQLKSGIESLSGMSMDHVKVHYNSDKPAQLQAHAYAQGSEIHVGPGQERHLPHEAWHIVQQAQGRVRPTLQTKAGAVNDDPSLEKEADVMGEKAAQRHQQLENSSPAATQLKQRTEMTSVASAATMRGTSMTAQLGAASSHAPMQFTREGEEYFNNALNLLCRHEPKVAAAANYLRGEFYKGVFDAAIAKKDLLSVLRKTAAQSAPPMALSGMASASSAASSSSSSAASSSPHIPAPAKRDGPVSGAAAAAGSAAGAPEHSSGAHNIVSHGADETHVLIPKYLAIKNLFRGDSRLQAVIKETGFRPGEKPAGYVAKLAAYLRTRSSAEAEKDARTMIARESGQDINNNDDGKKRPPTDLVHSLTKIEIEGGKKIILLNYVCSGPETGAGTTSYLIKVDEIFTCISASPTTGLYASPSGAQIVAVAQSAKSTGTVKFTEYDFLTPIPADKIYYASNDKGKTQVNNGNSWFRVTDNEPR
ncbi:eCIS core domain-containing protein [Trinickia dinghuensis]|uniref:DUF4157 domain-containing protein n=1 Tax=Trinickia dinghuensis TaxID=2291023 RepID=A0A3D8JSB6_9BURK|nr:DUF4157 domain-containing protein [Trinickia dinghuensis]RDU96013.1 DUF4157 domain-containing protein [Trinickia dinghuensis]